MRKSSIDVDIWKDDFQLLNENYSFDTRDNATDMIKHIADVIIREREQYYMDTINYLLDILEEVVSEEEFQSIKKEVLSDERS